MDNISQQIKTEQLDSISYGDNAFKKELIEIFLEQIPEFISNMKRFFEAGDIINLAKEAHTAKSSALIFGMVSTGELLKKIQLQAEHHALEELSSLINGVELEFGYAARQLRIILGSL